MNHLSTDLNNSKKISCDILIIGAGLAGLLLAFAYKKKYPRLSILVLEEKPFLGSDRTWSFHGGDIENFEFWKELIDFHWNSTEVYFSFHRTLPMSYHTIRSESFFSKMKLVLGDSLKLNSKVTQTTSESAQTHSGEEYFAKVVFDSRPQTSLSPSKAESLPWGFQKFYGIEVTTDKPHNLINPIVMEATVPQKDGYRFFYVLPLSPHQLLIEDTYYSNSSNLNCEECHQGILNYAKERSWFIQSIDRSESGVLPIPTTSPWVENLQINGALRIGAGAGFYHPITGYSILWATKVAIQMVNNETLKIELLRDELLRLQNQCKKNESFYLLLNRLLFYGASGSNRKKIFERFYRMPVRTIERFYAGNSNYWDRVKLLVGKPPIPIRSAIAALWNPLKNNSNLMGEKSL